MSCYPELAFIKKKDLINMKFQKNVHYEKPKDTKRYAEQTLLMFNFKFVIERVWYGMVLSPKISNF